MNDLSTKSSFLSSTTVNLPNPLNGEQQQHQPSSSPFVFVPFVRRRRGGANNNNKNVSGHHNDNTTTNLVIRHQQDGEGNLKDNEDKTTRKMQLDFTLDTTNQGQTLAVSSGSAVSERTKIALRRIVKPYIDNGASAGGTTTTCNVRRRPQIGRSRQFQRELARNSSGADMIDSYSEPNTPAAPVGSSSSNTLYNNNNRHSEECAIGGGGGEGASSSESNMKNARMLLAEKLRKTKRESPALLNGPLGLSPKKLKFVHHHSTPSSPLNEHEFANVASPSPHFPYRLTTDRHHGYSSAEHQVYSSTDHQVYSSNNTEEGHRVLSVAEGMYSSSVDGPDQMYSTTFADKEEVDILHASTPSMSTNADVYHTNSYLTTNGTTTTLDTVESVCSAVVAECRQMSTSNEQFFTGEAKLFSGEHKFFGGDHQKFFGGDHEKVFGGENPEKVLSGAQECLHGEELLLSGERNELNLVADTTETKTTSTDANGGGGGAAGGSSRSKKVKSAVRSTMCSFSNVEDGSKKMQNCRQRSVNGYQFCIRHILHDSQAPYRPCAYVKKQGNKNFKCNNAVPHSKNAEFCGTHLIMMGMREPKVKAKKKKLDEEDPTSKQSQLNNDKKKNSIDNGDEMLKHSYSSINEYGSSSVVNNIVSGHFDEKISIGNLNPQQFNERLVAADTHTATSNVNNNGHHFYACDAQVVDHGSVMMLDSFDCYSPQQVHFNNGNGSGPSSQYSHSIIHQHSFERPQSSDISGMSSFVGYGDSQHSPTRYLSVDGGNASSSDLARSHPELLSKLAPVKSSAAASAVSLTSSATVSATMFDDSNSNSYLNNFSSFHPNHQRYSNNDVLLFNQDPFLGPPPPGPVAVSSLFYHHQANSSTTNQDSCTNVAAVVGVMPSPVPSDLSVESVNSSSTFHSSIPPLPSSSYQHLTLRPSPPMSTGGCRTPSPRCSSNNNNLYGGIQLKAANDEYQESAALTDGGLTQLQHSITLVGGQQQEAVNVDRLISTSLDRQASSMSLNSDRRCMTNSSSDRQMANLDEMERKAIANVGNPVQKTKKVIRLKPKKRRMKMVGRYREIPQIAQMCRVIEDVDFDKSDLFPLGLEPSSSDSECEEFGEEMFSSRFDEIRRDDANDNVESIFSAARRQLYMLKKCLSFTSKELRTKNLETKFVGAACRSFPNAVGAALCDSRSSTVSSRTFVSSFPVSLTVKKKSKSKILLEEDVDEDLDEDLVDYGMKRRRCVYNSPTSGDAQSIRCSRFCVPYVNVCSEHLLRNVDQQLFRYCTYNGAAACSSPSLDAGLSETPKCSAHQNRAAYRAIGKLKAECGEDQNVKKKYKSRYVLKKHKRRRKNKNAVNQANEENRCLASSELSEDDVGGESEKEDDSNQEAQAALASVAHDFGFGGHDLADILVRMPDATLIENILGQDLSRSTSNDVSTIGGNKTEIDSIERALTATAGGDHNWADVEQFLMEENYISAASSTSPASGDEQHSSSSNVVSLPPPPPPPAYWNPADQQHLTRRLINGKETKYAVQPPHHHQSVVYPPNPVRHVVPAAGQFLAKAVIDEQHQMRRQYPGGGNNGVVRR